MESKSYRISGHFASCRVRNGSDCCSRRDLAHALQNAESSRQAFLNALKLLTVLAISGNRQLNIVSRRTADSSAALRATAPVRSLPGHAEHQPLQPLLPLPFPAPPLLVIFFAHLTLMNIPSLPISHFPLRFPYAFLTVLCPLWHICCLDTGFEHLPLVR
jgi:hypothetical protein